MARAHVCAGAGDAALNLVVAIKGRRQAEHLLGDPVGHLPPFAEAPFAAEFVFVSRLSSWQPNARRWYRLSRSPSRSLLQGAARSSRPSPNFFHCVAIALLEPDDARTRRQILRRFELVGSKVKDVAVRVNAYPRACMEHAPQSSRRTGKSKRARRIPSPALREYCRSE